MSSADPLARFKDRNYLNLETYRKSGEGVRTPVWFFLDEENGRLYVHTYAGSGKVKRLKSNPRVRVVPSGRFGEPEGEWAGGEARVVERTEARRANRLLRRKYGAIKWLSDLWYGLRRGKAVVIAIRV